MISGQARLLLDDEDTTVSVSPSSASPDSDHAAVWRNELAARAEQTWMSIRGLGDQRRNHLSDNATYVHDDAINWMRQLPADSIHSIVTDPPYGLVEYDQIELDKRASGSGGIWRIPPTFDGAKRSPVPRFTVLTNDDTVLLQEMFTEVATQALRVLTPGGHVFVASNPLLSTLCFSSFQCAGFEKRGEVIRLVQTLRGGDRPKGAEDEFSDVSVMARSCWEPWGIFRKPFEGTVAVNLRAWGTGGLRRTSASAPFKDVIDCSPTRSDEREIAPHPSLKPQRFLRQVVRASLPLGIGIVYDPFAGSASTLAAAEVNGYKSVGTDRSTEYFEMGITAFSRLVALPTTRA